MPAPSSLSRLSQVSVRVLARPAPGKAAGRAVHLQDVDGADGAAEPRAAEAHDTVAAMAMFRGRPLASVRKAMAEAGRRTGLHDATPQVPKRTAVTWAIVGTLAGEDAAKLCYDPPAPRPGPWGAGDGRW